MEFGWDRWSKIPPMWHSMLSFRADFEHGVPPEIETFKQGVDVLCYGPIVRAIGVTD